MNATTTKALFGLKTYKFALVRIVVLTVIAGFITRIALVMNQQTEVSFSFFDWLSIFLMGCINDICIGIISFFLLWLIFVAFANNKYNKFWGYVILGIFIGCLCYVAFFNTIFDEYGGVVPKIVRYFLIYKTISFAVRLFVPSVREKWMTVQYYFALSIYVFCIVFNLISEYVFWDEFGVRYNFIAVDYLIYTHEVIGNIMESYPIIPLFISVLIVSFIIVYLLTRKVRFTFNKLPSFKNKTIASAVYLAMVVVSCLLLDLGLRFQQTRDVFVNELQANGLHRFYLAFKNSKLEYKQFYITIPDSEAQNIINKTYNSQNNNFQEIRDSLPEVHKNIVLITIESLSGSFLQHYGNKDNITPNIDKLINESLVFNNLYATGNRTVRGLEALTLCLPPCPGESVIKQKNNKNIFSTGKILKNKEYIVQFLYGGKGYFDNMELFFSGNGYEVIDQNSFLRDETTFSNIWGVCDEDLYNKAIQVLNANAVSDKPFFCHIMTVSNHRPFTYPEGKIDIPANSKSRNGGVKYADYALGQFIEEAKKQSWFENTVFIITTDHCASSAGKVEIPLDKYHIPVMIYAPNYIEPQQINTFVSQIDIMPTVFGLLHFSYDSFFYGQNIFSSGYMPRVFVATYQNLGYWQDDVLTILSPVRKVVQYTVQQSDNKFDLNYKTEIDSMYLNRAIANYQNINYVKYK